MGEENCPRKKLEVSTPDAFPLLCVGTKDKNGREKVRVLQRPLNNIE